MGAKKWSYLKSFDYRQLRPVIHRYYVLSTPYRALFLPLTSDLRPLTSSPMSPLLLLALSLTAADPIAADLVLRGGTVYDGSNTEGAVAT